MNETKFDLIIDLQSKFRNSLILKRIPHIIFIQQHLAIYFQQKK